MKFSLNRFLFLAAYVCANSVLSGMGDRTEISETVLAQIFEQHCTQLKNTDVPHKPFVITFSGTPGMGKSFVAKFLEEKYQAVIVRTDDLRRLADATGQIARKQYEELIEEYFKYFMQQYKGVNKRFIIDASIDRRYVKLFPLFEAKSIPFTVIRLSVPRETVVERIKDREGDKAQNFLKFLNKWYADYEAFAQNYHNFITLDNRTAEAVERLHIPELD